MGSGFAMGPGGKGSNQAVAAARAGAKTRFISRIGQDSFGEIAMATWSREGIETYVARSANAPTGAAFIYVNDQNGENAIIVVPGAAGDLSVADVEAARSAITSSRVFVTQLEQPAEARRSPELQSHAPERPRPCRIVMRSMRCSRDNSFPLHTGSACSCVEKIAIWLCENKGGRMR